MHLRRSGDRQDDIYASLKVVGNVKKSFASPQIVQPRYSELAIRLQGFKSIDLSLNRFPRSADLKCGPGRRRRRLVDRLRQSGQPLFSRPVTCVPPSGELVILQQRCSSRWLRANDDDDDDYRLSTVGSQAFPVAAAQIWTSLPEHIVSAPTLQPFTRHLKRFYCNNLSVYSTWLRPDSLETMAPYKFITYLLL